MSDLAAAVGRQIRRIRRSKGMPLERLAELADLSLTFCGEIERGEKDPSLKTLVKLSRVLEIPLRDLVAPLEVEASPTVSRAELLQRLSALLKDSYTEQEAAAIIRLVELNS